MVTNMALAQRKVLILAADDFEDMELLYPLYRLAEEDVEVTVAGLDDHPVHGKKGHGPVPVDTTVEQVAEADFDALVIPGGYAPDKLRRSETVLDLVRAFDGAGNAYKRNEFGRIDPKGPVATLAIHEADGTVELEPR